MRYNNNFKLSDKWRCIVNKKAVLSQGGQHVCECDKRCTRLPLTDNGASPSAWFIDWL